MKKMLAAVLMIALAVIVPTCSVAEEIDGPIMTPYADSFFSSYGISMSNPSGSTIHIVFRVSAIETMDILGATSYDVQRLVGGTWTTVASSLSGSLGSDKASYSFSKNYSATSGYSYRIKARFYAKKYDGSSRTNTVTSSSIRV